MLALTHLVTGAALGRLNGDGHHRRGAVAALASHAVLDGVGHDDVSIGAAGQAVLVGAGLVALALSWGPGSPVTSAALAAVLPDAEIILMKLRRQESARLLFPSHWQREGRRGTHPYRFAGPSVPIALEVGLSAAACAALCVAGRWTRSRRLSPSSGRAAS